MQLITRETSETVHVHDVCCDPLPQPSMIQPTQSSPKSCPSQAQQKLRKSPGFDMPTKGCFEGFTDVWLMSLASVDWYLSKEWSLINQPNF